MNGGVGVLLGIGTGLGGWVGVGANGGDTGWLMGWWWWSGEGGGGGAADDKFCTEQWWHLQPCTDVSWGS